MATERLHPTQIESLVASWPEDLRRLGLEARALVLEIAPGLSEKVAFHSLCYYKPDAPYGVIGGNVCLVSVKHDRLWLAFLHGASLPDPDRELQGTAKAKRQLEIRTREDLRRPAVADLIRAAIDYDPAG